MSSILKALKKLEEQKAPRPQYELDLSSGIMRERRVGRHRRWVIPTGMTAVAIVAALTTYAVMALHNQPATKVVRIEAAPSIAPPPPSQPAPAPSSPAGVPAAGLRQQTDAVQAPIAGAATAVSTTTTKPAQGPRQQASGNKPIKPVRSAVTADIPSPPAASSPPPPEQAENTAVRIPNLKLSGIAWQADSASRYAVVNGMAVSQGSTIEGAKIEEILPDKVRFSIGTRMFEVSMAHLSPTR